MTGVSVPAHDVAMRRTCRSITHRNAIVILAAIFIVIPPPMTALGHHQEHHDEAYQYKALFHRHSPFVDSIFQLMLQDPAFEIRMVPCQGSGLHLRNINEMDPYTLIDKGHRFHPITTSERIFLFTLDDGTKRIRVRILPSLPAPLRD
jgi:hypothetical protein